jgi:hypothetical protein
MATTLVAAARILIPYTITGLSHKIYHYVRNAQVGGSTYKINTRTTDANDLNWEDAADGFAATLTAILISSTTFGAASLELRSGSVWNPVSFHTLSAVGGSSFARAAGQLTVTLRDTLFRKVKVVVMESSQLPVFKTRSPTGGDSELDTFIQQYLSTYTVTNAPYKWMVGRGNTYVNTSPFVSASADYNDKLRRARGV